MQPLAAQPGHQQQQQQQQPMDEAVVAAAMAAGMTFMQHLQAASGGAQPSPFSDINPLRRSAAAAAAASPGVSVGAQQAAGSEAASPEVLPSSGGGAAAAAHQQMIAGMFARMAVGEASPGQLDVAAASLHQHALALQQQHQHQQSVADSHQAPPSNSPRRSWRAFEDAHPQQQQTQQQQQPQPGSPQKLSRLGTAGNGTAGTLLPLGAPAAPPAGGIAGWDAMSKDDVARAAAIFNKKVSSRRQKERKECKTYRRRKAVDWAAVFESCLAQALLTHPMLLPLTHPSAPTHAALLQVVNHLLHLVPHRSIHTQGSLVWAAPGQGTRQGKAWYKRGDKRW